MISNITKKICQRAVALSAILAVILCIIVIPAQAEVISGDSVRLMQWSTDGDTVKMYVRGESPDAEASLLVDGVAADDLQASAITNGDPIHTIILLDNSNSTREEIRGKVSDIIKGIISGHADGEQFMLGTFSGDISNLQDNFSDDYTALSAIVDGITYSKQSTYLTDILYDAVQELIKEDYKGYTRIFVIADGADEKKVGIQRNELLELLQQHPYPIYCIGTNYGSNAEKLGSMFEISRKSNAEYCILEDTDTEDIVSMAALDNSLTTYSASIPEDVMNGGSQNAELSFTDGTDLHLSIDTPMPSDKSKKDKSPGETTESADTDGNASGQASTSTQDHLDKLADFLTSPTGIIVMAVIGVAIVVLIILLILRSKKAKRRVMDEVQQGVIQNNDMNIEDRGTVILDSPDDGGTMALTPGGGSDSALRYSIRLTDINNPQRVFSCEMQNGRARLGQPRKGNQLIIEDDNAVSHEHCEFMIKNGNCFIRDLNSSNGTFLGKTRIPSNTDQLVSTGSIITIGRATYRVTVTDHRNGG